MEIYGKENGSLQETRFLYPSQVMSNHGVCDKADYHTAHDTDSDNR